MEQLKEQAQKLAILIDELKKLNTDDLRSRELSETITCLETGSLWLGKKIAEE